MNPTTNAAASETQLETVPQGTSAVISHTEGENLEVSATSPDEMAQCQSAMVAWCVRRIAVVAHEATELKEAYEHAVKRKWKSDTLKRHAGLALKRVSYYEKIKAALEAGYFIVPPFSVTLFAIRTAKDKPAPKYAVLKNERYQNFQQEPQVLPAGQGDYQNPNPIVEKNWTTRHEVVEYGEKVTKYQFFANEWDEIDFPGNMSKPNIMEAATRAMGLKIFDELGFLPQDHKRNPDPILLGRIIDPRPIGGTPNRINFMIAWHLDTRSL